MEKHNCDQCKMRAKYDENPNSFLGRFWRWHIKFCPGWNGYVKSLDEKGKTELSIKYEIDLMH